MWTHCKKNINLVYVNYYRRSMYNNVREEKFKSKRNNIF